MIRLALAVLLALPLPAAAQWVAVGRWGSEANFRYVAPGTWMVLNDAGTTTITAEGDNHSGRIEVWCNAEAPAGRLRFSGYYGEALTRADSEAVRLVIDGQSFERRLAYQPLAREWLATGVLDSALLDAFAWGSRLELLNAAGERVTAYALNGSGAAREALRRGCRL